MNGSQWGRMRSKSSKLAYQPCSSLISVSDGGIKPDGPDATFSSGSPEAAASCQEQGEKLSLLPPRGCKPLLKT